MISPKQRPLPDTQHSQETNIHDPGGIRTHNPRKRATVDPRLRPRGHWDRRCILKSAIKLSENNFYSFSNFSIHVFTYLEPSVPRTPILRLSNFVSCWQLSPRNGLELKIELLHYVWKRTEKITRGIRTKINSVYTRVSHMKTLNCMLQAGPSSLHYYCSVVLHSCIVLSPIGHSSNHEYCCCQLTDNRDVIRTFIALLRFSFESPS